MLARNILFFCIAEVEPKPPPPIIPLKNLHRLLCTKEQKPFTTEILANIHSKTREKERKKEKAGGGVVRAKPRG